MIRSFVHQERTGSMIQVSVRTTILGVPVATIPVIRVSGDTEAMLATLAIAKGRMLSRQTQFITLLILGSIGAISGGCYLAVLLSG